MIIKEVNHTPNVKMPTISLSVSKNFLARHLFDDCSDGKVEFFKGGQMEQIQNIFCELSSPNIRNFMTTSKSVVSLDKFLDKRCSFSRCP